jgi:bacterioferritin
MNREEKPFFTDIMTLRDRARENMMQGAITDHYGADKDTVIRILNNALATELVCILRYRRHYYMVSGIAAEVVSQEFLKHAEEEQEHADWLAERITQLGGEPDFSPEGLQINSHTEYIEGTGLKDMLKENLVAERIAIDTYREIIKYLGDNDPTTKRILEDILAVEEEHADDMSSLLSTY